MTREEAFKILELYRHWNEGQQAFENSSDEQRILDERRALILEATRTLNMTVDINTEPPLSARLLEIEE